MDSADLYAYFDEHVAREPELFDSSEAREHDGLLSLVTRVSARLRSGFSPLDHALFEVRGTGFWHGVMSGHGSLACFFYDERSGKGLVAVCNPADDSDESDFTRFSYVMARRDERLGRELERAVVAVARRAGSGPVPITAPH